MKLQLEPQRIIFGQVLGETKNTLTAPRKIGRRVRVRTHAENSSTLVRRLRGEGPCRAACWR